MIHVTGKRGYALVGYWPHQFEEGYRPNLGDVRIYQSTYDPEKCTVLWGREMPVFDMYYNVERQEYELRTRFSFKLLAVGNTPEHVLRVYKATQRVKGVEV